MSTEWPAFYPTNIVLPPNDSVCCVGNFFRLVFTSPPQSSCFQSTHEEYPSRHKKCRGERLQNVYGTSFFDNQDQAIETREKFPEALGTRIVAQGDLTAAMGKMKQTFNPGHFTVWIKRDAAPVNEFSCCE